MNDAGSPRVGLLTPYGGTNLGDNAIQDAAIQGFRTTRADVRLVGITLDPVRTAAPAPQQKRDPLAGSEEIELSRT